MEVLPALMTMMHMVSEKHINRVCFFGCEVYSCVMRVKSDKCTNGPMKSIVGAWSSVALVVCQNLPKSSASMPPYSPLYLVCEQPYKLVVSL